MRTAPASSCQATLIVAPGSGLACWSALLNNSLMTTAASLTAASRTPAVTRSDTRQRRATLALEAANGSSSTLDLATSFKPANQPQPVYPT
jgi:hypothetical protein